MSDIRDDFIEGAARAFWVSAWLDWAMDNDVNLSGVDAMEYAPETPFETYEYAEQLADELEAANGMDFDEMFEIAENAVDEEADPADWGHYTAMQAMGHGVAWAYNKKKYPLKIPYIEHSYLEYDEDLF